MNHQKFSKNFLQKWHVAGLCLLCASLVQAPSIANAAPLSLTQATQLGFEKSPELQQLQNQVESAAAKKRQALSFSEPTLSVNWNDMRKAFNLSTIASHTFQIAQPIGFPGRALLNRSQLSTQEEALSYQYQALKLQVSTNVKQAHTALALAEANLKLNEDTRLAYERILAIAKRRYEAGQTTQVDYLNSQVALLNNENDLTDLQSAHKIARVQLNILLKNPPEAEIEVEPVKMTYHPLLKIEDALPKMLESRNEIRGARAQASGAGKSYKLAWMSALPDFQLIAGTTFYDVPSASPLSNSPEAVATGIYSTHTFMAGIQMTLPIWFLFNEREIVVGASHDRAAAEAALDVVYNQSRLALETTVDSVNSLSRKIETYEKHLMPLSEQAFNLALVNYSSGKIDFQTLSDTAASRRTQKIAYAQAVANYFNTYATYGQLIGEDL